MKKTFYIILISVFAFIILNTIFYLKIYKDQKDFQTELLSHQIRICGNTIEQYGLNFENEVNYILYSENINLLFTDPDIKERGLKNLDLFYSKYSALINNITVYGNQKNVYSLILDKKNNFVSDYYESQQQIPLLDRDKLFIENRNYYYSIPVFKENQVYSNIVIALDFLRYIGTVFDQYKFDNTTVQWLITEEEGLVTTNNNNLIMDSLDLNYISDQIREGNEGSLLHNLKINNENNKVISVFYPVRLIKRNFGIIFSIKTSSFLQSVIRKIIFITIASLLLMALILYIHFWIIQVKSSEARKHEASEQLLHQTIDNLPVGMIILNQDQTIRMINQTAQVFLLLIKKEDFSGTQINQVLPSGIIDSADSPYNIVFGEGILFKVTNGFHENVLFRREFITEIESTQMRVIIIFNVTHFEKLKTRNHVANAARSGLIKAMSSEIFTPIDSIRSKFQSFNTGKLSGTQKEDLIIVEKSIDLLENLIKIMIDFSSIDAGKVVIEDIPYQLRNEINIALESFKPLASVKNISIITKIKNDVPEKINGDPFRLRQAISQILENSIENTEKGRILISAEIVDQSLDHFKIKFQIEDTGNELAVDQINEYLHAQNVDELTEKSEFGATGLRMTIAKQHIELMKGNIWLESPSSISTHPDFPGTKYNFIIEIIPDILYSKNLKFGSVQNLNDIKCVILSQINDPDDKNLKLFEQIGIDIKQRIYRNDNLDSIIQYLKDHQKTYQMIVILDRPDSDGFKLASRLYNDKLVDLFLILMISSKHNPVNTQLARKYKIDHYLTQPYESYIISEIIKEHFTGISVQSLTTIPKGVKINQNLSILLAEDNLFNRKVNQTLFKSLGFEIDLAQNGNEVIKMVKNKNYDIVFMDLIMPELDGFETSAQLRKMNYTMPIVALTAVETDNAKQLAIENGINDYLVKPATIEDIRKILLSLFSESV